MTTSVLEAPPSPVTPTDEPSAQPQPTPRLPSDLLRLGASFRPQARLHVYNPETGGTCALGALYEGAMGKPFLHRATSLTLADIEAMVYKRTGCNLLTTKVRVSREDGLPSLPSKTMNMTLREAMVYLNDHRGWTREHIACYLERKGL